MATKIVTQQNNKHGLENILWLSILVSRIFGGFPIQMYTENGVTKAGFLWKSWQFVYWAVFTVSFMVLLTPYIPFAAVYLPNNSLTDNWENGSLDTFCKLLFILGHCTMVCVNLIILIPMKSTQIAKFWNHLQLSVLFFSNLNDGQNIWHPAYIKAILYTGFLTTVVTLIGVFTGIFFRQHVINYFVEPGVKNDFGWFLVWFLFGVSAIVVTHLYQSVLFYSFANVISTCYSNILHITKESKNYTKSTYLNLFHQYCELEIICNQFSNTYGLFIIFELVVMLMTTITNVYFGIYVLLGIEAGYHPIMPFVIVPAYCFWLWLISDMGEKIHTNVSYFPAPEF